MFLLDPSLIGPGRQYTVKLQSWDIINTIFKNTESILNRDAAISLFANLRLFSFVLRSLQNMLLTCYTFSQSAFNPVPTQQRQRKQTFCALRFCVNNTLGGDRKNAPVVFIVCIRKHVCKSNFHLRYSIVEWLLNSSCFWIHALTMRRCAYRVFIFAVRASQKNCRIRINRKAASTCLVMHAKRSISRNAAWKETWIHWNSLLFVCFASSDICVFLKWPTTLKPAVCKSILYPSFK